MLQFRKLILVELYTAFILLYIQYYSSVWHFCGARNVEKLENLNKRILTFTLGHFQSTQDILLDEVNCFSIQRMYTQYANFTIQGLVSD